MGFFDSLFGKKKTTLADADKKNDTYIAANPTPANDENGMMRQAAKLMSSQKFAESIELYTKLANDYPAKRGLYESQVGVGHFFLGDYEKAFETYVTAWKNGADAGMMDDNIWEAAEALYKKNGNKSWVEQYLQHFPKANHKKAAEKILIKDLTADELAEYALYVFILSGRNNMGAGLIYRCLQLNPQHPGGL
eukprot:gene32156-54589_t